MAAHARVVDTCRYYSQTRLIGLPISWGGFRGPWGGKYAIHGVSGIVVYE